MVKQGGNVLQILAKVLFIKDVKFYSCFLLKYYG